MTPEAPNFEAVQWFLRVCRTAAVARSRKVRTPQGMVLGNTQAGRPDGKCNREQTADGPHCGIRQG